MKISQVRRSMKKQAEDVRQVLMTKGFRPHTKNWGIIAYVYGVRVAWDWSWKIPAITIGADNSDDDNIRIAPLLKEMNLPVSMEIHRGNELFLLVDPTTQNLEAVIKVLSELPFGLETYTQDPSYGRIKNDYSRCAIERIVNALFLGVKEGCEGLYCRETGIWDRPFLSQSFIKAKSAEWSKTQDTYHEHVVPVILLMRESVERIKKGSSKEDIHKLIKENLALALITKEEAARLDYEKRLQTKMPNGWKWGDDPFARLNAAGISFENC